MHSVNRMVPVLHLLCCMIVVGVGLSGPVKLTNFLCARGFVM